MTRRAAAIVLVVALSSFAHTLSVHEASALVTGASVAAAEAVWNGTAEHAANIAGGLHHALRGAASGFGALKYAL